MTKKRVRIQKKGLGDITEDVIKKTGVKKLFDVFLDGKDCGCEDRKEKLNNIGGTYLTSRCMTENEYNTWKEFNNNIKEQVNSKDIDYITTLYASLFSLKKTDVCRSCKPTKLKGMINMINKVSDIYTKELNNE